MKEIEAMPHLKMFSTRFSIKIDLLLLLKLQLALSKTINLQQFFCCYRNRALNKVGAFSRPVVVSSNRGRHKQKIKEGFAF